MTTATYEEIRRSAIRLSPFDQLRLLRELAEDLRLTDDLDITLAELATSFEAIERLEAAAVLRTFNEHHAALNAQLGAVIEAIARLEAITVAPEEASKDTSRRSILELRGRGKGLWRSIDSTAYLNEERAAWDG